MQKVAILGASRGLGSCLAKVAAMAGSDVRGFARKAGPAYDRVTYHLADFSNEEGQCAVLENLLSHPVERVFITVGGGPFGPYGQREFKDHLWAWQVTFLFPARVVHALMATGRSCQIILTGSSVAESHGDPGAASYASAKHALHGLHSSLRLENPEWDLRLFSPGYMDTTLLPRNAAVRSVGVWAPEQVAEDLWEWALGPDKGGHRVYQRHPA